MQSIQVQTQHRCQMIDVTEQVQAVVRQVGVKNGRVICYVPHTTAGVTIQEHADPDVVHDLLYKLEHLIPQADPNYRHNEGNSDAHIKTSLVGISQTILVEDGRLCLGTWQGIFFCEFDGPRMRQLYVQCTP